ncbi:hypothetical protein CHUAL_003558 [Chamberlinius hualienensis]
MCSINNVNERSSWKLAMKSAGIGPVMIMFRFYGFRFDCDEFIADDEDDDETKFENKPKNGELIKNNIVIGFMLILKTIAVINAIDEAFFKETTMIALMFLKIGVLLEMVVSFILYIYVTSNYRRYCSFFRHLTTEVLEIQPPELRRNTTEIIRKWSVCGMISHFGIMALGFFLAFTNRLIKFGSFTFTDIRLELPLLSLFSSFYYTVLLITCKILTIIIDVYVIGTAPKPKKRYKCRLDPQSIFQHQIGHQRSSQLVNEANGIFSLSLIISLTTELTTAILFGKSYQANHSNIMSYITAGIFLLFIFAHFLVKTFACSVVNEKTDNNINDNLSNWKFIMKSVGLGPIMMAFKCYGFRFDCNEFIDVDDKIKATNNVNVNETVNVEKVKNSWLIWLSSILNVIATINCGHEVFAEDSHILPVMLTKVIALLQLSTYTALYIWVTFTYRRRCLFFRHLAFAIRNIQPPELHKKIVASVNRWSTGCVAFHIFVILLVAGVYTFETIGQFSQFHFFKWRSLINCFATFGHFYYILLLAVCKILTMIIETHIVSIVPHANTLRGCQLLSQTIRQHQVSHENVSKLIKEADDTFSLSLIFSLTVELVSSIMFGKGYQIKDINLVSYLLVTSLYIAGVIVPFIIKAFACSAVNEKVIMSGISSEYNPTTLKNVGMGFIVAIFKYYGINLSDDLSETRWKKIVNIKIAFLNVTIAAIGWSVFAPFFYMTKVHNQQSDEGIFYTWLIINLGYFAINIQLLIGYCKVKYIRTLVWSLSMAIDKIPDPANKKHCVTILKACTAFIIITALLVFTGFSLFILFGNENNKFTKRYYDSWNGPILLRAVELVFIIWGINIMTFYVIITTMLLTVCIIITKLIDIYTTGIDACDSRSDEISVWDNAKQKLQPSTLTKRYNTHRNLSLLVVACDNVFSSFMMNSLILETLVCIIAVKLIYIKNDVYFIHGLAQTTQLLVFAMKAFGCAAVNDKVIKHIKTNE